MFRHRVFFMQFFCNWRVIAVYSMLQNLVLKPSARRINFKKIHLGIYDFFSVTVYTKYHNMLRPSLTLILVLSTVSGCISTTKPPTAFTAQVDNEITDPSAIQTAKAHAVQSRVEFQQSQQNSGNQYASQPYDPSGYVQGQFIPASGPPEGIQPRTATVANASFEVSPRDQKAAEKLNYASLPNIRVVGTIAVPEGAKVLIQRDEEDSIIRRVGEEIVHAGEKYSIRKITESGEVILESPNAQFFSIR